MTREKASVPFSRELCYRESHLREVGLVFATRVQRCWLSYAFQFEIIGKHEHFVLNELSLGRIITLPLNINEFYVFEIIRLKMAWILRWSEILFIIDTRIQTSEECCG